MVWNIYKGQDGKYFVKQDASGAEKAVTSMANFGVNAQNDINDIVDNYKQLPGAFIKAGEEGPMGSAKLLGNMIKGYSKGLYDIISKPKETIYNKPVSTFFTLAPIAKMATGTPTISKTKQDKINVPMKKGETFGKFQNRIESPDLKAYTDAMNKNDFATAESISLRNPGNTAFSIHKQVMPSSPIENASLTGIEKFRATLKDLNGKVPEKIELPNGQVVSVPAGWTARDLGAMWGQLVKKNTGQSAIDTLAKSAGVPVTQSPYQDTAKIVKILNSNTPDMFDKVITYTKAVLSNPKINPMERNIRINNVIEAIKNTTGISAEQVQSVKDLLIGE